MGRLGPDGYRRLFEDERLHDPHRVAMRDAYRKTANGQERLTAGKIAWIARNPEKRQCHVIFGNALRDGKIERQPCQRCSNPRSHAHHKDYSKPLKVRWLCAACHSALHKRERRRIANADQ
jgi:ribosomal protein S27AE